MGRINSTVGLITGIPIEDTVNKIIAVEARPRDALVARTETLQKRQAALTELTSRLLSLQVQARQLANVSVLDARKGTSSNSEALTISANGATVQGTFLARTLQLAQNHRVATRGFSEKDQPIGPGKIVVRRGAALDQDLSLRTLNGGRGVQLGKIRIYDRTGSSAEIDLSAAVDLGDVLDTINRAVGIRVRASLDGDRIRLDDESGGTQARLRVEGIDFGTAEDLGLARIDVDGTTALGNDIVRLGKDTLLGDLNDGRGISFDGLLADLRIRFRGGGDPLDIDFSQTRGQDASSQVETVAVNQDAVLRFTAVEPGVKYEGVQVRFENNRQIKVGEETVELRTDSNGGRFLVFQIDEGHTTADHVVAALERDTELSREFRAERAEPRFAVGTTNGADPRTQLAFRSRVAGLFGDEVSVRFVDDDSITAGAETVRFVTSGRRRTLEFHIDAGATTTQQITEALARSPLAESFSVERVEPDPRAVVTTQSSSGANGAITFIVRDPSIQAPVEIRFIARESSERGKEVASYDAENRVLTVGIAADESTADDVIRAVLTNPDVHRHFLAVRADTGNGRGLVQAGTVATTPDVRSYVNVEDRGTLHLEPSGYVTSADGGTLTGGEVAVREPPRRLGEFLAILNAADPERLEARISADGKRVELIDKTSGNRKFSVESLNKSSLVDDLGIQDATAEAGTIAGSRLLGGLGSVLVRSLVGKAELGSLRITDRAGLTAQVDLSGAETLDEVLRRINSAAVGVEAGINELGTGLTIRDTTGRTSRNLTITDGTPGSGTAAALGIAVDDAVSEVNGADVHLATVGRGTLLSDFQNGQGVRKGQFFITNSTGKTSLVDLDDPAIRTLGDVIDAINLASAKSGLRVSAEINEAGDGLLLLDKASGVRTLRVQDAEGGHTAADLRLVRAPEERIVTGTKRQVINGTATFTVDYAAETTLEELVEKINSSGAGVTASIGETGSRATPYQLVLDSTIAGALGAFRARGATEETAFHTVQKGQDALLRVISGPGVASARTISSETNDFDDVVEGVSFHAVAVSTETVTLSVAADVEPFVNVVKQLVDAHNQVRAKIKEHTAFNENDATKNGVLFGRSEVLRLDTDLSRLFTTRLGPSGKFESFGQIGVEAKEDGTLVLNESRLRAAAGDPEALGAFLSTDEIGAADVLDQVLEQLVGRGDTVLVGGGRTAGEQISLNITRIEQMNLRLENSRRRLLNDFYSMELAIAKLQDQLTAISSFTPVPPLSAGGGTR